MTRGVIGSGRDRSKGRVLVEPVVVYNEHLMIVPPELFEKVQRCLQPKKDYTGYSSSRRHASNIKYVLSGIGVCAYCGHPLTLVTSTSGYRRVGCTYKADNRFECRDTGYSMAALERIAVEGLRDLVQEPSNVARYQAKAVKALSERKQEKDDLRERLQEEANELNASLDRAMMMAFSPSGLNERRRSLLEEMENRLADLTDRINELTLTAPPTLSPEALQSLREIFDELLIRAPFIPTTAAEIAVFTTLRKLISAVRVRRVTRFVFEATVDYDLGPLFGVDDPSAMLSKTFQHDVKVEVGTTRKLRVANLQRSLAGEEFQLTDEMLASLSDFPTFHTLFGSDDEDARRAVVRVLLFRGAYNAPRPITRQILGPNWEQLELRVDEFRQSACVPAFVEIAQSLFPGVPFTRKAVELKPSTYKSVVHRHLSEQDHPFARLAMCRPDALETRISDRGWKFVTSLRLCLGKKASKRAREHDAETNEKVRPVLEALAMVVREGATVKVAAESVGLARHEVTRMYSALKTDGRLMRIAKTLLELESGARG